jgi:hypothetical protein
MPRNYRPWTPEEAQYVREARAKGCHAPDIAAALGRSVASIRNFTRDQSIPWQPAAGQPMPTELPAIPERAAPQPPPEPRDPVEVERERQEHRRALKEEREALQAVAGERSLRAMLDSLFRDIVPVVPPPPRYVAPKAKASRVVEAALMQWTDWHYGEVVKSERVRGFNAYDQDTATKRVRSVVRNARGILSRLRTGGHEFPRAVLAVNGDLVTGSIHDLEKHSNGKTIVESVVECGNLLAEAVRDVAADFDRVDVFCTVGNHGRMPDAKRMEQKSPLRNWDALVYYFAQVALRDVPNVTVTIPDAYAIGYEILGWRFLQQHGHEVKSWGGIPWYGIERYVSRITALEAQRDASPHVYLFGHFHTITSLPHSAGEMFVNGSLIGGTEYSVNALGKSDKPAQWLLGVHQEHGISHRWPVYPTLATGRAAA